MIEEKDKDFSHLRSAAEPGRQQARRADRRAARACRPAELDLDDWRELLRPAAQSRARGQHRRRRQVRRAPRRLQVDLRSRSTTPASPTARRSASAASRARTSSAKGPSGCSPASTASSCPAASASAASRARSRRSATPASEGIPFFGICLGMQCAVIEFARNVVRPRRRPLDRVRQGHAAPGDLPARRAEVDHRQGRHDAARRAAGAARAGQHAAAAATAATRSPSGTGTATSSTTSTASSSRPTA